MYTRRNLYPVSGHHTQVEDPAASASVASTAHGNSVQVCVMTWNLAEESPPASDVDFLRKAAEGCGLVAVGVQEIENLKPRRNEGRRTREWRRLLIRLDSVTLTSFGNARTITIGCRS